MKTSFVKPVCCFVLALIAVSAVHAQSSAQGILLLYKHPPVNEFVRATRDAQFPCENLALEYWNDVDIARYGKGDTETKFREVLACVAKSSDVPKEKLIAALKYLEGMPGTAKALKDVYLKWVSKMDSLAPAYGESYKANSDRKLQAGLAIKQAHKAMELELQLGT